MERKQYVMPTAKVHIPRFALLAGQTMPVGSDPNDEPIESKRGFFEDEDNRQWGRVWGRMDDE